MKYYPTLVTLCLLLLAGCCQTLIPINRVNHQAAHLHVELAMQYLQQQDLKRAKQHLLQANQLAPHDDASLDALAYYYEITFEVDKAHRYYQQAIAYHPDSGAAYNNYGTYLCRHSQYKAAIKQFLLAVKQSHYIDSAGAYENAGRCALLLQDHNRAKYYLQRSLRYEPHNRIVHNLLKQLA